MSAIERAQLTTIAPLLPTPAPADAPDFLPGHLRIPRHLRPISAVSRNALAEPHTHIACILEALTVAPLSETELRRYASELQWAVNQIVRAVTPRQDK